MRASEKIHSLVTEGCNVRCVHYNEEILPEWFDGKKFKRGQSFFNEFIFIHFLMKMSGLLYVSSVKNMFDFLKHTNNTNTPEKIKKRFSSTISHMCVWYDEEFTQNSKLWQSLSHVRLRHLYSDKLVRKIDHNNFISQKDIAFTQFAFMGLILLNPDLLGSYPEKEKDLEAFIHFWRVIGYLIGIEDRFNFCDGSLEDVTECSKILTKKYLNPSFHKIDNDYNQYVNRFIKGMSDFIPCLDYKVNLIFICKLCKINPGDIKNFDANMRLTDKLLLIMYNMICFIYRYKLIRYFINLLFYRVFLKNIYKIK